MATSTTFFDYATPVEFIYTNLNLLQEANPSSNIVTLHRTASTCNRAARCVCSDVRAKRRRHAAHARQEALERRKEANRAAIKNILLNGELDIASEEVRRKVVGWMREREECEEEQRAIVEEQAEVYNILAETSREYFGDAQLNFAFHQIYDCLHDIAAGQHEGEDEQLQYILHYAELCCLQTGDVMRAIQGEWKDFQDSLEGLGTLLWAAVDKWTKAPRGHYPSPTILQIGAELHRKLERAGINFKEQMPEEGEVYIWRVERLLSNEQLLRMWLGEHWIGRKTELETLCDFVARKGY